MKALIIDEPWISLILNGEKTWEMRKMPCHLRGEIGLIRKGSGGAARSGATARYSRRGKSAVNV